MPPKSTSTNKSDLIRKYAEKHPSATPLQIEAALKQHGITAAYASLVLYKERQRHVLKEAKKTNGGPPADVQLSYAVVLMAIQLIQQTGGLDQAISALKVASELRSLLNPSPTP